jgi:hypothetical protein
VGDAKLTNEHEVLFNCYNVFKVIRFYEENHIKILEIEAFSHLEIISKKLSGKAIT